MKTRMLSDSRVSSLSPGRIALGYAVIAILWIAFSDAVVTFLKLHPIVMTIKGTLFVLVTASLLYFTVRRLVQAVQRTSQERDDERNRGKKDEVHAGDALSGEDHWDETGDSDDPEQSADGHVAQVHCNAVEE